jgi:hypothetical protein
MDTSLNTAPAPVTGGWKQQLQPTSWPGQLLALAMAVISAWQLFAKEIHAYIDGHMDDVRNEMLVQVAIVGEGQMLMLTDSLRAFEQRQAHRLEAIEERVGLRGNGANAVVTMATRDSLVHRMKKLEALIEQLVEAHLDGAPPPANIARRYR